MGVNQSSFNIPRRGGEIVPGFVAIFPTGLMAGSHAIRKVGNYPLTDAWKDNIRSLALGPNTLVKIIYLNDNGVATTEEHSNDTKDIKTIQRNTNKAFELNVSYLNPALAPTSAIQEGFYHQNIDFWTIMSCIILILLIVYLIYNF